MAEDNYSQPRVAEPQHIQSTGSGLISSPNLSLDGQKLCKRCSGIDLAAAFDSTPEKLSGTSFVIAELGDVRGHNYELSCILCGFFRDILSSISKDYIRENWILGGCDSLELLGIRHTPSSMKEHRSAVLKLTFGQELTRSATHFIERYFILGAIPSSPMQLIKSRFTCAGRLVLPLEPNYDLLSEWIYDCEKAHKACRVVSKGYPEALKVIDCQTSAIVFIPPGTKYFTLSYVWGEKSERIVRSKQDDRPGLQAARTVLDAMTVVLRLGEQYLWVDRHCIDSNNVEEKKKLISRMDDIYEGAFATLIALGNNAQQGLPGVSYPRKQQPCIPFAQGYLVSTMTDISSILPGSSWNSRGWTYQEFCLSRRCLIFTDDQVHFLCKAGTTCESIRQGVISCLPSQKNRGLDPRLLRGRGYVTSEVFARNLTSYSIRQLSCESDGLNAFRGILSRSTLLSYWGVPVFQECSKIYNTSTIERGFAHGLAWVGLDSQPLAANTEGFPSWSWAFSRGIKLYHLNRAYIGQSRSKLAPDLAFHNKNVEYSAKFYVTDGSNDLKKLFSLEEADRSFPRRGVMAERGRSLTLLSYKGKLAPEKFPRRLGRHGTDACIWMDSKRANKQSGRDKESYSYLRLFDFVMLFRQSPEIVQSAVSVMQQRVVRKRKDMRSDSNYVHTLPGCTYWLIIDNGEAAALRVGLLEVPRQLDDVVLVGEEQLVTLM